MSTTTEQEREDLIQAIRSLTDKRIFESREATKRLPDDGKQYSMLMGIASDMADDLAGFILARDAQREAEIRIDELEKFRSLETYKEKAHPKLQRILATRIQQLVEAMPGKAKLEKS